MSAISRSRFDGGISRYGESFALAIALLFGLIIFAPVFEWGVTTAGLPIPQPLLVGVGLAWIAYGIILLRRQRLVDGLFIGLLIASTFHANIPLTNSADVFVGDVVGSIMMYYGPLALLLGSGFFLGWYRYIPNAVYIFAAFVGATILSAFFGGGPNMIAALWFSVFVFVGLLVYLITILAVRRTSLSLNESIGVFFIAVCSQALVGTVQLLRGETFGLSELGEPSTTVVSTLSFPLVGPLSLGTHVSGFTGMSFQLANLLILTFPLLVVFYTKASRWKRFVPLGGALLFILLIRGSSSDAARGAFIVALVTFGVLGYAVSRPELAVLGRTLQTRIREIGWGLISAVGVVLLLLYPSSASGDSSSKSVSISAEDSPNTPTATTAPNSGTQTATASNSTQPQETWLMKQVDSIGEISILFFDLSNLGTRLNQYVAALNVFARYPIFGLGGENFVLVGQQYSVISPGYTEHSYSIHSIYFQLLANTGILGLITFVLTVVLIFVYGYRAARVRTDDSIVPLALLAGLSGTLAFMIFDTFLLGNAASWAQFWIIAGFVTVSYQQATNDLVIKS